MTRSLAALVLMALVLMALAMPTAQAQTYAPLSYANLVKTMARFKAFDAQQDEAVDDYLKVNECEAYARNFRDDFNLRRLRRAAQQSLAANMAGFPDAYHFQSDMQLDKYDFDAGMFMLKDRSQLRNINSFMLYDGTIAEVCVAGAQLKVLPSDIGAVLDQPVTVLGLPITEAAAEALLKRMNDAKNFDRIIYARFSLMVAFAPPVLAMKAGTRYNMDAQLLHVEFFEDKEYTKPIWIYTRT